MAMLMQRMAAVAAKVSGGETTSRTGARGVCVSRISAATIVQRMPVVARWRIDKASTLMSERGVINSGRYYVAMVDALDKWVWAGSSELAARDVPKPRRLSHCVSRESRENSSSSALATFSAYTACDNTACNVQYGGIDFNSLSITKVVIHRSMLSSSTMRKKL